MILASASPRRAELLEQEGYQLDIQPAFINEMRLQGEGPEDYALRMAHEKAVYSHAADRQLAEGQTLVAADTVVWLDDGTVFGKPIDEQDARRMLKTLSGITHHVTTGVSLVVDGNPMHGCISENLFVETTDVTFYELSDADIDWYISTGEPFDKSGGYGIQGRGRKLVKSINGDFYNVVGLPMAHLLRERDRMFANISSLSNYWF